MTTINWKKLNIVFLLLLSLQVSLLYGKFEYRTIQEIQDTTGHGSQRSYYNTQSVSTSGIIYEIGNNQSYYMANGSGEWSGILLKSTDTFQIGDSITVFGTVRELSTSDTLYGGSYTFINYLELIDIYHNKPLPSAIPLNIFDIKNHNLESLEGTYVSLTANIYEDLGDMVFARTPYNKIRINTDVDPFLGQGYKITGGLGYYDLNVYDKELMISSLKSNSLQLTDLPTPIWEALIVLQGSAKQTYFQFAPFYDDREDIPGKLLFLVSTNPDSFPSVADGDTIKTDLDISDGSLAMNMLYDPDFDKITINHLKPGQNYFLRIYAYNNPITFPKYSELKYFSEAEVQTQSMDLLSITDLRDNTIIGDGHVLYENSIVKTSGTVIAEDSKGYWITDGNGYWSGTKIYDQFYKPEIGDSIFVVGICDFMGDVYMDDNHSYLEILYHDRKLPQPFATTPANIENWGNDNRKLRECFITTIGIINKVEREGIVDYSFSLNSGDVNFDHTLINIPLQNGVRYKLKGIFHYRKEFNSSFLLPFSDDHIEKIVLPEPESYACEFNTVAKSDNAIRLSWLPYKNEELPGGYYLIGTKNDFDLSQIKDSIVVEENADWGNGAFIKRIDGGLPFYEVQINDLDLDTNYNFYLIPYANLYEDINYKIDDSLTVISVRTEPKMSKIFWEDFEDSFFSFSQFLIQGEKYWVSDQSGDNNYIWIHGYFTDKPEENWLVTQPLDLSGSENTVLEFDTDFEKYYSTNVLKIKVSQNYDGHSDPTLSQFNWIDLTTQAWLANETILQYSGLINLSQYRSEKVFVAFQYINDIDDYRKVKLDNIRIKSLIDNQPPEIISSSVSHQPIVPQNEQVIVTFQVLDDDLETVKSYVIYTVDNTPADTVYAEIVDYQLGIFNAYLPVIPSDAAVSYYPEVIDKFGSKAKDSQTHGFYSGIIDSQNAEILHQVDSVGNSIYSNFEIAVNGVVSSPEQYFGTTKISAAIQISNDQGLNFYSTMPELSVNQSQVVTLYGKLEQYYGLLRLDTYYIEKSDSNSIISPVEVSFENLLDNNSAEYYEGSLIQINDLMIVDTVLGFWGTINAAFNVKTEDADSFLQMRISSKSGFWSRYPEQPDGKFIFIGYMQQYDIESPLWDNHRLIPLDINTETKLDDSEIRPTDFKISHPYPNPFNPYTNIRFYLTRNSKVKITLYNILGQIVQNFESRYNMGMNLIRIDGTNLSSGVYFVKFEAEKYKSIQKIVLMK